MLVVAAAAPGWRRQPPARSKSMWPVPFLLLAAWATGVSGFAGGGRAQRLAALTASPSGEEASPKEASEAAGATAADSPSEGGGAQTGATNAGEEEASSKHHLKELDGRMADLSSFVSSLEQAHHAHEQQHKAAGEHSGAQAEENHAEKHTEGDKAEKLEDGEHAAQRSDNQRTASFYETMYYLMAGGPHEEMKARLDNKFVEMTAACNKFRKSDPDEKISQEELELLQKEFGACVDSVWQFAHLTKQTQRESHTANIEYHNKEEPFVDVLKVLTDKDNERDASVRADYSTVNKVFDDGAEQILSQIKDEFPGMKESSSAAAASAA